MTTKLALKTRRLKIKALIAKGLQPQEIMDELEIRRRTYYTDLEVIHKESFDEARKNYSIEKMLNMRDELLRGLMLKRVNARTDEVFIKASMAADQCLSSLVKDLARLGLVPQEKQSIQIQETQPGMVSLTWLKQQALEALEREKQDAESETSDLN
jgi:hypothetical protein